MDVRAFPWRTVCPRGTASGRDANAKLLAINPVFAELARGAGLNAAAQMVHRSFVGPVFVARICSVTSQQQLCFRQALCSVAGREQGLRDLGLTSLAPSAAIHICQSHSSVAAF